MAIHTFKKSLAIAASVEECWAFFSDPQNLARITPPWLAFKILSQSLPAEIYPGLIIRYQVRPLLDIPREWLTEITHVDKPRRFVDEQRHGPYRLWHHEHSFVPFHGNRVLVGDLVTYILPFGWLGNLAHPLFVRRQLNRIFDYRAKAVKEIFGRNQ
jgi:ligand-binding SRPBCC domain-containing protein